MPPTLLGSEGTFAGQRVIKGGLVMTTVIKDMELSGRSEVPYEGQDV